MPPPPEKANYIGLVRLSDNIVLASVFSRTALPSQKAPVERFFLESIQNNKPFKDKWRKKQSLDVQPGNFFLQVDYNFAYGAWLKGGVSDTNGWDFMKEAISLSKEFGAGMSSQGALELNKDLKKPLRDLMDELNDRTDTVGDAQLKIENVQVQMQDNMRKMMGNQQDVESLEASSQDLSRNAAMFQTSASSARKQAQRRSLKMKLCVAIIVLAVICFIVIEFIWPYSHFTREGMNDMSGDADAEKVMPAPVSVAPDDEERRRRILRTTGTSSFSIIPFFMF